MSEVLVRGEDLSRVYGSGAAEVVALRQATFTIPAGARIALVGPSGSGKSTLLHLIAGVDRPSGGRLSWPGVPAGDPLRPGFVGVAFQGLSLLPQLDVAENVALPLVLGGAPSREALAEARVRLGDFALDQLADALPEQVSGGQAQRAAVARAVVGTPRLVVADEPTGQQDRTTGAALLDTLWARAEALGAALVVATHDEAVAARFPTRWTLADQRLYAEEALRSR